MVQISAKLVSNSETPSGLAACRPPCSSLTPRSYRMSKGCQFNLDFLWIRNNNILQTRNNSHSMSSSHEIFVLYLASLGISHPWTGKAAIRQAGALS